MTGASASSFPSAKLVAIDWGTSNLRLWVMDDKGDVLAEARSDKGMSQLKPADYPHILDELLADYDLPASLSIVICGMAGARAGWQEAPYLFLPASFTDLASHAIAVTGYRWPISIIGGMAQKELKPDVMRGEETLLYGAYISQALAQKAIICLPGTHSKWVHLNDDKVTSFSSFMTGELYQLISHHSLLSSLIDPDEFDEAAFQDAVQDGYDNPQNLSADLFGLRAANLLSHHYAKAPASRLSGLLIGTEIAGALPAKPANDDNSTLYLLASGKAQRLYQLAFSQLSLQHEIIEADNMAQKALFDLSQHLAS